MGAHLQPMRATLPLSALDRSLLASFANTTPEFCSCAAMCVVLPPGAEDISSTRSPGWGSRAMTGRKEEAAWRM